METTTGTPVQAKDQAELTTAGPNADAPVEPAAATASPSAALAALAEGKPRRGRGKSKTSSTGETAQSDNADGSEAATSDSAPKGPSIEPGVIAPSVEAILISADRPIPPAKIAESVGPSFTGRGVTDSGAIRKAVELLNETYASQGRSFRIEAVSGGLRLMTRPEYAEVLARFHGQRAQTRLSRAAIESLAIIAYKQPITRAEVEAIRGVASGEILKTLMERRLVTITGRAEELGRPMLYGTTRQFLELFGLSAIKDLPPPEEFGLR